MKKAYTTFIKKDAADWLVYVPDMDIYTQGTDVCNAMAMARDAIGLKAVTMQDKGMPLPDESDYAAAIKKAKEDTEDIDFTTGICTMVDVDIDAYRTRLKNMSVKKNCTIPAWLNDKAEAEGINFSKALQAGLRAELGL